MKTITAIDLRKKLGSVLDEISKKGKQVAISRANKPLAIMISVKEYEEKILKKDREKKLRELSVLMDQWKENHLKKTHHLDVVKVIREIREGR